MSQVSIIDIEGNHPQIPTQFNANVGFAIPLLNILEIFGELVAPGTIPIQTVGSGNNITTQVQISQAVASSTIGNNGLSHFNSAQFAVDPDGFVSLLGGSMAIDSINVDANTPPGTDPVVPDGSGQITVTGGQVAPGTTANVIQTNSLAANTYSIEIQRSSAQALSSVGSNGVSHFDSAQFTVDPDGFVSANATGLLTSLTPDEDFDGSPATAIFPQSNNINIFGVNPSFATVTDTLNSTGTAAGNLQVEHRAWQTGFVVDASATPGTRGTFTTIQAAITAAVAGQTVFIRPSTTPYTENLTLKAGVNLAAFTGDGGSGTVTIIGTATLTTAGTVAISGIRLQTDGAFLLAVTGTAASVVKLYDCFLNITDNTGISFTSSDAASSIMVIDCWGNIGTTGITTYAHSGAGNMRFQNTTIDNSGASTTASTVSGSGSVQYLSSYLSFITTTSSTSSYLSEFCQQGAANAVALTCGGTGNNSTTGTLYASGNVAAISVGTGATLFANNISVRSSANPAITGLGNLTYNEIAFQDTGNTINTSTLTPRNVSIGGVSFDGGTNTLANYATGTFTPTIIGGSVAGTTTYTAQNGYYTRIGNIVFVQGRISISSATGTGDAVFGGLPFTVKNQTNGTPTGSLLVSAIWAWPVATGMLTVQALSNTTTANIWCSGSSSGGGQLQMTNASATFAYSLVYQI